MSENKACSDARRVKVVIRTKPTAEFAHDQIELGKDGKCVNIHLGRNADQKRGYINNKQQDWSFPVDAVLHDVYQESVYETCAQDLITQLMNGFNGTLLAYGETGAGKTYTMCGPPGNYQDRGIIPRAITEVFCKVKENKEYTYRVYISYLEIYNEVVFDLLTSLPLDDDDVNITSPSPLTIAEDERRGVYVKGLTCRQANNEEDALNMLFEGQRNRTTAEHSLNKFSSRSHCIFTITVEARSHSLSSAEYTVSRLNLVDLAGSERLSKTKPNGSVETEAMYINRSLSFLEQVIVALKDSNRDHIPYRQSKLTHILKDSLGGNSHTVLIANVWTEFEQIPETLSTLKFTSRVKCVKTNPVRNTLKDPQLLLKEYEKEIESLKEELAMHNTLLNRDSVSYDALSEPEIEEIRQQVDSFLHGTLTDIELVSVHQLKEVFAHFKTLVLSQLSSKSTEGPKRAATIPQSTSKTKKESKSVSAEPSPETVGDTEGIGVGLGVAPASIKHPASPATAMKKSSKTESKRKESKSSSKRTESPAASLVTDDELAPSEIETHEIRPDTPPAKPEAFEDFKRQRGSEINQVFVDNKEMLHRKKKELLELSTVINTIKKKMNELHKPLKSESTEPNDHDDDDISVSEPGVEVMEDWKFNALCQLKELKGTYRQQYKMFQSVQQEVEYCSQYVAESRRKLVEEFDKWYTSSFIGDTTDRNSAEGLPTKNEEKMFDTHQAMIVKDPSSMTSSAYYTAQLRTERRGYHTVSRGAEKSRMRTTLVTTAQ